MQLYGRTTSYNVQKVLWLLTELNLDFKHIECGGRHGGLDSEQFLALNPLGKVPVLIDDNKIIRESNTILRYLAASYGGKSWWFDEPYKRSQYEIWMDWSIDVFEPAFVGVFWGYYRTPDSQRDWNHIKASQRKCQDCLSIMNNQLKNADYLCANTISLADISIGVFIYRLVEIDLDIALPEKVHDWYLKLLSRNGYKTYVMSDFSELKGRLQY